jgi:hypothetical protein
MLNEDLVYRILFEVLGSSTALIVYVAMSSSALKTAADQKTKL